jgi:dUTP pyrophosphatase
MFTNIIKFKKLNPDIPLPARGTVSSGCWDVVVSELIVEKFGKVTVKLGFATEFNDAYCMQMVPRSGISKSRYLMANSPGQIDADYRGEWMMKFTAVPEVKVVDGEVKVHYGVFPYSKGERVGQIYLRKVVPAEFHEVKELSDSGRGQGGFGSTGQ